MKGDGIPGNSLGKLRLLIVGSLSPVLGLPTELAHS